jgi:predicted lipoprotein
LKPASGTVNIKLLTGNYFGNAIRDLSGYIQMGDFKNSMDYNLVASELNKIVFNQVINPFKTKAVKGAAVQFVGCAELNRDKPNIENSTIIPLKLKY